MAVEKVLIATVKFANNWFTVTDNNGREVNVGTVDKKTQAAQNPKLKAILENAKAGDEVEIDVRDWQGKFYGNDPKSAGSGGKSFTLADKSFDAGKVAAQATGSLLALQKDITFEKFEEMANKIHSWILSKKSA